MSRNAVDIHEDISRLYDELRELSRSGRITMSNDSWNQDHTNSTKALEQALEGLQNALDATRWMETLPAVEN